MFYYWLLDVIKSFCSSCWSLFSDFTAHGAGLQDQEYDLMPNTSLFSPGSSTSSQNISTLETESISTQARVGFYLTDQTIRVRSDTV